MIVLGSSDILRARLAAAPAATQPAFVFAYGDDGATPALGSSDGALNGTANVTLVGSPAASYNRVVRSGSIYNADSADATVTLEVFDGTTAREVLKILIPFGQSLFLHSSSGWQMGVEKGQGDAGVPGGEFAGINMQIGTTYTFVLSDAGKNIRLSNAAAITVTIPTNASVPFPANTVLYVSEGGGGPISVVGATGVTVNDPNSAKTAKKGQYVAVVKVATDEWDLV